MRSMSPRDAKRYRQLNVQITPDERRAFLDAAETSGMPLSGWVRFVLRKASGMPVPGTVS
jgi:hypothetical protein